MDVEELTIGRKLALLKLLEMTIIGKTHYLSTRQFEYLDKVPGAIVMKWPRQDYPGTVAVNMEITSHNAYEIFKRHELSAAKAAAKDQLSLF